MNFFFIQVAGFLALIFVPVSAYAQDVLPPGLPMIEPANPDGSRCVNVFNNAPFSVTGSLVANLSTNPNGAQGRQRINFRLKSKEGQLLCSTGPFYPGERLELVLRTLVPVFSCYTVVQGDLVIMGETKFEGRTKMWANCQ